MSKAPPCYALRLPASKRTERFIEQLRGFANYGAIERIRVKYSGPRPRYAYDCKREDATAFRVYIDTRGTRALWRRSYTAEALAAARLAEIERLRVEEESARVNLHGTMYDLERERVGAESLRGIIRAYQQRLYGFEARIATCPRWLWRLIDFCRALAASYKRRTGQKNLNPWDVM